MAVIKFKRWLLESPRIHEAARDRPPVPVNADEGHLWGIDHEDGQGVVEYVLMTTTDGLAVLWRVVEKDGHVTFAQSPEGLYTKLIEAWERNGVDAPLD